MSDGDSNEELLDERYEFRVWGQHRKAVRKLANMASSETSERIEDCYVLVDDPDWNAKVRDSALKLKQLVSMERGFERYTTNWHHEADSAPAPFDEVFEDLSLDRPQRGKSYNIQKAVKGLDDDSGTRVVFVTKHRRRFRIGSIKAEATRITVKGGSAKLHTVAIEGSDLDALVALRRELGLKGKENLAMHVVLENEAS